VSCRFCANNRTNLEWELDEEQVFYAMTVGMTEDGYRIMYNKKPYRPLELIFEKWNSKLSPTVWQTMGVYYPKYCPECGRKIDEYDRSKFDNYG